MTNKLINVHTAATLIPDAATLSLGDFSIQRHPMAFVFELIRLNRRNLYPFA
jgi:acyl CoA:acetate/3-ketoacid CoA transferase alpha subunit